MKFCNGDLNSCIFALEQGPTGLGFAIGEGMRAQDGEQGIFIRNITEGGAAYKVRLFE